MKTLLKLGSMAVLGGSMALVLAGCNVGPKYKRPVYPAPPAFRGADDEAIVGEAKNSIADQQWTQIFKEPELQALITQALANNYDLRIAAQRILEQQAQVQITRSQQFPTISAGGTGAGAEIPSIGGSSITSPLVVGSFNLSAAWNPDFWGLYRKQTEAARDQLLAQTWAQRAVRLTLVQQVVTAYIQLRALDHQLEIARQTYKIRQDSVGLTRQLETGGSVPLSDVRQAEQLLYTASSQIPQLEQQVQQQENAIKFLLGDNPGTIIRSSPTALSPVPQNLPVGLPSELLERRPDIQQTEAQLKAANANIGVARAQFFPQLSISASGGVGGDSFPDIFKSGAQTVYGIGSLSQPLFAGGKLRGQLRLSQQTEKEMVLNYQKTIAGAFRDVSNALIAVNKQRAYREQQQLLVDAAKDATRLARIRYQGGSTGYLEVLTTDSNLFSAQLSLVTAQQNEALTLVQLYAALGGGWQ
ncbi:efflux transporter outer membrane subunit [Terriglobus saanensis]|uniref:RND efflux system, outer membrane lipoprotein, NodT family n=1 Tax=Terriglobus saanensis (strain ATCC BAA-1853 / DSM 23119 / SP1PR4) TaxID=401053 RepID=E8V161_TERSS|nr:efflux transporter outer membrane subunit [Terriglobus saanensis]ADV83409.1 RND efflux system, outer membrane lipoprotein, NodT family [Terriglobus saanensis SP1PR4]